MSSIKYSRYVVESEMIVKNWLLFVSINKSEVLKKEIEITEHFDNKTADTGFFGYKRKMS